MVTATVTYADLSKSKWIFENVSRQISEDHGLKIYQGEHRMTLIPWHSIHQIVFEGG